MRNGKPKVASKYIYFCFQENHKWGKKDYITTWDRIIQCTYWFRQTILKPVEKWLICRPWKYVAKLLWNQEIKQEVGGEANEEVNGKVGEGQHTRIGKQKKRREYTN